MAPNAVGVRVSTRLVITLFMGLLQSLLVVADNAPPFTLYTLPKRMVYPYNITQMNAIRSWMKIKPTPEIVLIGDDEGVKEVAEEYGLKHVPGPLKRSWYGAPLVSDIIERGESKATAKHVCLINADIVLPQSFGDAMLTTIKRFESRPFLLTGIRYNSEVFFPIDFDELERKGEWLEGERFMPMAQDYFAYVKGTLLPDPKLSLLFTWDNWITTWGIQQFGLSVDVTDVVKAIHQDHSYVHQAAGSAVNDFEGKPRKENREVAKASVWDRKFLPSDCTNYIMAYCGDEMCLKNRDMNTCYSVLAELDKIDAQMNAERMTNRRMRDAAIIPRGQYQVMEMNRPIETSLIGASDPKLCPITTTDAGMSPRSRYHYQSCGYEMMNLGFRDGVFLWFGDEVPEGINRELKFSDWVLGLGSDGGAHPEGVDPQLKIEAVPNATWDMCDEVLTDPTVMFSPMYMSNVFHGLHDVLFPLYRSLFESPMRDPPSEDLPFLQSLNNNIVIVDSVKYRVPHDWSKGFVNILAKSFTTNPIYSLQDMTDSDRTFCMTKASVGIDVAGTFSQLETGLAKASDMTVSGVPYEGLPSLKRFVNFVEMRLGIVPPQPLQRSRDPLISFISRQGSAERRLDLEGDLIAEAERQLGVSIQLIRLEMMGARTQIESMKKTDILLGVHGAGFANSIWLPPNAVVGQILPYKVEETQWHRSFERLAVNSGITKWVDFATRLDEVKFKWDLLAEYIDDDLVPRYRDREQVLEGPNKSFDWLTEVRMRYFWLEQDVYMGQERFTQFVKSCVDLWYDSKTHPYSPQH